MPKGKKKTNLELKIGNRTIQEVNHLRFLGVYIDNWLNFNEHFKKVLNKVQNGLRGLIMSKHFLSYRAKLNIYHALIHSHLSYCAIIWLDSLNSKQLNQLKIIQKKCIRIIFNAKYNSHTSKFFEFSRICKIENLYEKEALQLTFKYFDRALPKAIMNLYNKSLHDPKKVTRSIEACSLHPKPFLKPGNMMFNIITHWNQISPSLRNEKSLKEFKAKIINIQNTAVDCVKQNCYSCNYNYQNLKNLIRY